MAYTSPKANIDFENFLDWQGQVDAYWKSIRMTEPMSAWEILERVIDMVKEQPARLDMRSWGGKVNPKYADNPAPECGTVCCFAGWAEIIMGHEPQNAGYETANILDGPRTRYDENGNTHPNYKAGLMSSVFINSAVIDHGLNVNTDVEDRSHTAHVENALNALVTWMTANEQRLKERIVQLDGSVLVNGQIDRKASR